MLTGVEGCEEQAGRVSSGARPQELVDLDDDGLGYDQVATDASDERRRELVSLIAPVRRRQQRPRVGNDPQRAVTSSRR